MKQSSGREGDGDGGARRARQAEDGRGPLRENSGRTSGLPPRVPPERPPRALSGPRAIESHRDAEESPRKLEPSLEEEELLALAVRPRGAPRERP